MSRMRAARTPDFLERRARPSAAAEAVAEAEAEAAVAVEVNSSARTAPMKKASLLSSRMTITKTTSPLADSAVASVEVLPVEVLAVAPTSRVDSTVAAVAPVEVVLPEVTDLGLPKNTEDAVTLEPLSLMSTLPREHSQLLRRSPLNEP